MKNFTESMIGAPATLKTQRSLFKNHIEPYLEDRKLDLNFVQDMVHVWLDWELRPGSIRQLISLLKRYIQWETGVLLDCSHIVRKVGRMDGPKTIKAWTKEERNLALATAKAIDTEIHDMMLFTLHTGVRKGEMQALKAADLDFIHSRILIRQSKNGRPRTIPMSVEVEELLQNGYIVGEEDKHIFSQKDPNDRLARICSAARVRILTWHGLRHTFATIALEAAFKQGSNISPRTIQQILGHTKFSTTVDLYWSCVSEDLDLSFLT